VSGAARIGVVCILGLLLGGCETAMSLIVPVGGDARTGNWRIERVADPVSRTGQQPSASLPSRSWHSKYTLPRSVVMQITCAKTQPQVRFAFDIRVGSSRTATVEYRFDDRPLQEVKARFRQESTMAVLEDEDEVAELIGGLTTARALHLRIRSLNLGVTTAEFRLDGAASATAVALMSCPPAGASAPPQRAAGERL
jgi:hypothetical protein